MARICDCCGAYATAKISFSDGQEFDLCESDKQAILDLLEQKAAKEEDDKPRRGRPKKNE